MADDRTLAALRETAQAFGGYLEGRQDVSITGTFTPDLAEGNLVVATVTGDVTISPPTLGAEADGRGVGFVLVLVQDGVGGHTVTWDAAFKWPDGAPPTLVTTAGAVSQVGALTYDDGASWLSGGSSGYA